MAGNVRKKFRNIKVMLEILNKCNVFEPLILKHFSWQEYYTLNT